MSRPDFNLLVTLDVLLAEGSVARAARRLRLSPASHASSINMRSPSSALDALKTRCACTNGRLLMATL